MMALQGQPARAGAKSRVRETASLPQIPALLQFLEGLAANDNRSWLLHNKPQHEILHEEFIALVDAVGSRVRAHDPAVEATVNLKAAPVTDLAQAISTRFENAVPMMSWLRSAKK